MEHYLYIRRCCKMHRIAAVGIWPGSSVNGRQARLHDMAPSFLHLFPGAGFKARK